MTVFHHSNLLDVRASALAAATQLLDDGDLTWATIDVGFVVAVGFATDRLRELFSPSLQHLLVSETTPDLRIVVADSTVLGPHPPLRPDTQTVARTDSFSIDDVGAIAVEPNASISALHWQQQLGVWWLDAVSGCSSWQVSAPLRQLLAWWAPRCGKILAHTAIVGDGTRGVMITGEGGAGKSTTTMQCGLDGIRVLSDDYCIMTPGAPPDSLPVARAATRCCKLSDDSLALLGNHVGTLDNSHRLTPGEKNLVYLPIDGPDAAPTELEIVAVVVPSIGTETTATLHQTQGSAALSSLAMSSIFQFNADPAAVLRSCRQIVEHLPTYELHLGSDLSSASARIAELLNT